MSLERAPLQIVELDVDQCTLTYGTSPCTASGSAGAECFNMFKHCQDPANFDKGTLTLRFSKNQRTGITGQIIFPALQSVSTNPTRIALSSVDKNLGALGKRARITVTFKDFRWTDQVTDPYVATRSYDPATQGTFFGRLRTRFPYYVGRALRVKNGYVGDDPATMRTRNYIITEWKGPDANGNVTVTAQDPLKLADEEFAQCPAASNGKLAADIAGDYLSTVDLTPAGVGSEYAASGRIAIGSEVMTFTRAGDTLTITARGLDGTDAQSHSEGDTAQQCYRAENALIEDVVRELLRDFAGIPTGQLPYADWATELNTWLSTVRLTRTIPKPVAVRTLLQEILNFGIVMWWDEIDQEVKVKANRPPGYDETFATFNDDANHIEKTINREDLDDQRLSQVWMYHGQLDAADSPTNSENYKRLSIATDLEAEGADEYDQSRALTIYQPWLGEDGNEQFAGIVTKRLLNRYRDTPVRFTFHADVKDIASLTPAALAEVTTRLIQDEFGADAPTEMQITGVEELPDQQRVKATAETYQFKGRYGFIMANSATTDYDLATAQEKAKGIYLSDGTNNFADGTPPYVMF